MGKRRNRQKQSPGNGMKINWQEMALVGMSAMVGSLLPPRGSMPMALYFKRAERVITSAIRKKMAKLGTIYVDPEFPDNWSALMHALVLMKAGTVAEFDKSCDAVDTLAGAAEAPTGSSPEQQAAAAGVSVDSLMSAQTWGDNTKDWWSQLTSGDVGGSWGSFTEGWDAFWSGNF